MKLYACHRLFCVVAVLLAPLIAQAQAASPTGREYWLEDSITPDQIWVQAQAVYTLRFFQSVAVRDLQIHAPQAAQVEMRSIGDAKVLDVSRDGQRYRVTERRYALTPFASGELRLTGAYATGTVPDANSEAPDARLDVRVEAGNRVLQVLPIPAAAANSAWLPARALALSETWSSGLQQVRQGEALRRTLRIEAQGMDAAQIPAMAFVADGFSIHPEPARIENRDQGDLNVGVREQSYRMVPLSTGQLQLPELQLFWWNVQEARAETAMIPARRLFVAASAGVSMSTSAVQVPSVAGQEPAAPVQPQGSEYPGLRGLLLAALLLLVAGLFWMLLVRWRQSAWQRVCVACRRDDAAAAQQALLQWALARWPDAVPRTLGEIAARMDDARAANAIMALDRHLYGPAPRAAWDGRALLGSLAAWRPVVRRTSRAALPPLYPR